MFLKAQVQHTQDHWVSTEEGRVYNTSIVSVNEKDSISGYDALLNGGLKAWSQVAGSLFCVSIPDLCDQNSRPRLMQQ